MLPGGDTPWALARIAAAETVEAMAILFIIHTNM
jgi:hypothetical protein